VVGACPDVASAAAARTAAITASIDAARWVQAAAVPPAQIRLHVARRLADLVAVVSGARSARIVHDERADLVWTWRAHVRAQVDGFVPRVGGAVLVDHECEHGLGVAAWAGHRLGHLMRTSACCHHHKLVSLVSRWVSSSSLEFWPSGRGRSGRSATEV
jgi:hypothetical protein